MSTHTPNRVQPGVAEGGQFARQARAETDVNLPGSAGLPAQVSAALAAADPAEALTDLAHQHAAPIQADCQKLDAALSEANSHVRKSRIPAEVREELDQTLGAWHDWREGAEDHEHNLRYDIDNALASEDPASEAERAIGNYVTDAQEDKQALRQAADDLGYEVSTSPYVSFEDSEEVVLALGYA